MRRLLARASAALAPALVVIAGSAAVAAEPMPAASPATVDVVVGYAADDFRVLEVPAADAAAFLADARADDDVAWAEVEVPMRAAAATPNDPYFPSQWGLTKVSAPAAWDRSTGSADVLVAVVDTGVDATHPELAGRVDPQVDTVGDGATGDPNGHGTGVAGVIGATTGNSLGIAGYCSACRILPVRALDASGAGTSTTVARGIVAAADRGADVINLSLAGAGSSSTVDAAIAYARDRGALVVAAAGNSGSSVPHTPAASPGVIGVAATNELDDRYWWSNYGTWADVAAPGCGPTLSSGHSYTGVCGTSFAAPAVAGALALAIAAAPSAPRQALESALLTTADPIAGGIVAGGRIDVAALLQAAIAATPAAAPVSEPAAHPSGSGAGIGPGADDGAVEEPEPEPVQPAPDRVAGTDRVATAVALSARVRTSATDVVIARADSYADALAAAPLAGTLDAPVLLTPSSALAPAVAAEVERLGATRAWIVGGSGAVGDAVADQLGAAGVIEVRRLAGVDRTDTARRIALEVGGTSAVITAADGWADAVAVSALAALTRTPILLATRTGLPPATVEAIAALGITRVTAIGGPAAVPDAALDALRALGVSVTRLAGTTRYGTSAAVADATVAAGAAGTEVWTATGSGWPDALAAGPAAAAVGGVLVLVDGIDAARSPETLEWVQSHAAALVVVGGHASISSKSLTQLAAAVG